MRAAVSRDLPIPASPDNSTTCPSPVLASDHRRSSRSSSSSRPTSSVSPLAWRASKRLSTGGWSQRRRCPPRSGDTLEVVRSQVLKLEHIAQELPRALRNDHAVRLRNALQACRKIRRLANDCLLLRSARPDQVTDAPPTCRNADARLQGRMGLQSAYSSRQLQPERTARSASSSWACG